MSKENVKKFYEALKADKALVEELQSAVKAANAETPEQVKTVVLQFAAEKNFAFTTDEAVEFETEARELSEEELDKVNAAGGGFCFFDSIIQTEKPVRCGAFGAFA